MNYSTLNEYYNKYCIEDNKALKLQFPNNNFIIEPNTEINYITNNDIEILKEEKNSIGDIETYLTVIDLKQVISFSIINNEEDRKLFDKRHLDHLRRMLNGNDED